MFNPRRSTLMLKMAGPLLLSLLVFGLVFGPLTRGGAVMMLDWVISPRFSLGNLWGFPGSLSGVPFHLSVVGLLHTFPPGVTSLAPLLAAFFLASWGILRLTGSFFPSLFAALLFTMSPFMYDRMLAGHIGLLLGYALLPVLVSNLVRARSTVMVVNAIWVGLIAVILVALSPHFVFIVGLVLLAVAITSAIQRDRSAPIRIGATVVVAGLLSTYWLIPSLSNLGALGGVTSADVTAFRTVADPQLGLFANAAGLYGFWHREWPLPKDGLSGWWIFFLAMLVVIGIGAWNGLRNPERKRLSLILIISGVLGFFLALGDQGPTGSIFLWMFNHVPGFKIMREPQKFLVLLVLAYAFFYGLGSDWLVKGFRSKWLRAGMAMLLIALPCIYTYKMFWGFNGYVKPSKFPDSWAQADKLMGEGQEKALALPWHLYMAFPWTQNRLVANPMSSYFRRETIVGDNIELGDLETQSTNPRSHYLEFLYSKGIETKDFGNLVVPLGIKYVALAKEQDWRAYEWLFLQRDLRVVREWDDLVLFENTMDVPLVYAPKQSVTVEDWGEVVGLASRVRLVDYAIEVAHPGPGPVEIPAVVASAEPFDSVRFESSKPIRYEVESASSAPFLVLAEPFHEKWAYRGRFARRNLGVTNLFVSGPEPGTDIFFTRWTLVRTGYLISGATFLALIGWLLYGWVRRRRGPLPRGSLPG